LIDSYNIMNIAVIGAGEVGQTLVYRLVQSAGVSSIVWLNRDKTKVKSRIKDLEQGLPLMPTCRHIVPGKISELEKVRDKTDVIVLAGGQKVPEGKDRYSVFQANVDYFRTEIAPSLCGFGGIIFVVTNPVDLMAREIYRYLKALETGDDSSKTPPLKQRIIGLGTVVETSRLKAELASQLGSGMAGRDVWAFAVGTHDELFVPVAQTMLGPGIMVPPDELPALLDDTCKVVVRAAQRMKELDGLVSSSREEQKRILTQLETLDSDLKKLQIKLRENPKNASLADAADALGQTSLDVSESLKKSFANAKPGEFVFSSTIAPVIEGIVSVLESIAFDRGAVQTVSVLDELTCDAPDEHRRDLFYSMPCALVSTGIAERFDKCLNDEQVSQGIDRCKKNLSLKLSQADKK
jgi:malate/lactate dehydrogenase